jgi:hypothetical protein
MATEIPQSPQPQTQKKKLPGWVKLLIILAIAGVGLSVLATVGLGLVASFLVNKGGEKAAQKAIEQLIEKGIEERGGGKADVDISEGGVVVKDKEGGQQLVIRTGQELPSGFPDDVPVFSPSQVSGSMVMGPMTMVTLESSSKVPEIVSYYQGELPSKGWSQSYFATPDNQNFSALYKKENRQLTVTASSSGAEGKTSIVLSYGVVP